jgi:hypothetical protein
MAAQDRQQKATGLSRSLKAARRHQQVRTRHRRVLFLAILAVFVGVLGLLLCWSLVSARLDSPRWLWYLILSVCLGVWSALLFRLFRHFQAEDRRLTELEDREWSVSLLADRLDLKEGIARDEVWLSSNQESELYERAIKPLEEGARKYFVDSESGSSEEGDAVGLRSLLFELMGQLLRASSLLSPLRRERPSSKREYGSSPKVLPSEKPLLPAADESDIAVAPSEAPGPQGS